MPSIFHVKNVKKLVAFGLIRQCIYGKTMVAKESDLNAIVCALFTLNFWLFCLVFKVLIWPHSLWHIDIGARRNEITKQKRTIFTTLKILCLLFLLHFISPHLLEHWTSFAEDHHPYVRTSLYINEHKTNQNFFFCGS